MVAITWDDFVCPSCGGGLRPNSAGVMCGACHQHYSAVQGVPMLLPGLRVRPGMEPDPGFVDDMAQLVLLKGNVSAEEAMRDLFSTTFEFPDRQLGVEGNHFLNRLRSAGYSIRELDGRPAAKPTPPEPAPFVQAPGARMLTPVTVPPAVRAGQDFWVQVRVTNTGPSVLRSDGPDALALSYATRQPFSWRTLLSGSKRGWPWARSARLSNLLIDLPPGQALTQPVLMTAAGPAGPHDYRITPVAGGADWLDAEAISIAVTSVEATQPDPLLVDWPYAERERGYDDDHFHAADLLGAWLRDRFAGKPAPRVLEIGGNAGPMLRKVDFGLEGARYFNADIDPFGLAFGTVQQRLAGLRPVQDLMADGMRLPFADRSLDAIVMFATLHHFPDPVTLLRHLRSKLAPGGLICACCEPVGHVSRETMPAAFQEELRFGICEQVFEPWEWRTLFEQAGLRTVVAQHDRGSLKIALEAGMPAGRSDRPAGSSSWPGLTRLSTR